MRLAFTTGDWGIRVVPVYIHLYLWNLQGLFRVPGSFKLRYTVVPVCGERWLFPDERLSVSAGGVAHRRVGCGRAAPHTSPIQALYKPYSDSLGLAPVCRMGGQIMPAGRQRSRTDHTT